MDVSTNSLVDLLRLCLVRGWSGGAMVLGKLPVPGRPTIWMIVGQGPTVLAVGAGGGCLDIFTLIYLYSPLSPSLWETARYRLKYCLKGPLNPKQPTNQLPGSYISSQPSSCNSMVHLFIVGGSFVQDLLNTGIRGLCKIMIFGAPSRYMLNLDFAHFTANASFSV